MKAKELASALNGMDVTDPLPKSVLEKARAAGLVIVHGEGSDKTVFRGAIEDSAHCPNGSIIYFDAKGILPEYDDLPDFSENVIRDYFDRKRLAIMVQAEWQNNGAHEWTYTTALPHRTFEILQDGAPYCRAIVFSLADVAGR